MATTRVKPEQPRWETGYEKHNMRRRCVWRRAGQRRDAATVIQRRMAGGDCGGEGLYARADTS